MPVALLYAVPVELLYMLPEDVLVADVELPVVAGDADCLMPEDVETLLTDVILPLPLLLADATVPDDRLIAVEPDAVRLVLPVTDVPLLRLMLLDATPIPSVLRYPLVPPLSPQCKSYLSGPPQP